MECKLLTFFHPSFNRHLQAYQIALTWQSDTSEKEFASAFDAMKKAYANKHGVAAIKAGTFLRLLSCCIEMIGFNILKDTYDDALSNSRPSPR